MQTYSFSPFPILITDRLVLRRKTQADAEAWYFFRTDPGMMKYLDKEPAKDLQEVKDLIKRVNEGEDLGDSIAWAISLKDNPEMIGSISFWRTMKEHHRAEIGYVLHTNFQGKGIMMEAAKVVLDYGFGKMKLHSVEANINPANDASRKMLERLNFVKEAHFKENYYFNGVFLDSAIYSLIAPPCK